MKPNGLVAAALNTPKVVDGITPACVEVASATADCETDAGDDHRMPAAIREPPRHRTNAVDGEIEHHSATRPRREGNHATGDTKEYSTKT